MTATATSRRKIAQFRCEMGDFASARDRMFFAPLSLQGGNIAYGPARDACGSACVPNAANHTGASHS